MTKELNISKKNIKYLALLVVIAVGYGVAEWRLRRETDRD